MVGWPPVRKYRKNNIQAKKAECESGVYTDTNWLNYSAVELYNVAAYT